VTFQFNIEDYREMISRSILGKFPLGRLLGTGILALQLASCATPVDPPNASALLAAAKKVTVLSVIGDEFEWVHYGFTVFENAAEISFRRSGTLDNEIADVVAKRLQARGIRATPSSMNGSIRGLNYPGPASLLKDLEPQRKEVIRQMAKAAASDGADFIVVLIRLCESGQCRDPRGANGVTVQSRSMVLVKNPNVEVCVQNYTLIVDGRTGEAVTGRMESRKCEGHFRPEFAVTALRDSLARHDDEIARLALVHFSQAGAVWIDRKPD
jgi:hypothetical protein